jgi:hypothetical protein
MFSIFGLHKNHSRVKENCAEGIGRINGQIAKTVSSSIKLGDFILLSDV